MPIRSIGAEILGLLHQHFVDAEHLRCWINAGNGETFFASLPADTEQLFDARVASALNDLNVSHTQRFTSDQIEYFHLLETYASVGLKSRLNELFPSGIRYSGIGLLTQVHDGRHFVASLAPGGPAAIAGLRRGDELIAVNGRPFSPVGSFKGLEKRAAALVRRRTADRAVDVVSVRPVSIRPGLMFRRASRLGARTLAGTRRTIGCYRPWSLAGEPHWRLLVRTLSGPLRDCDALVLDLRFTIGGASPEYAEFFVGRSPELRISRPGHDDHIVNPRWRKPVVVIADETTRSGNEVLVFALQRAGIPVVGRTTAGKVSAAKPFLLSDDSLLLIATLRVVVDGVVLEGRGVAPDVAVDAPLPYADGADPQLDAAITLADG